MSGSVTAVWLKSDVLKKKDKQPQIAREPPTANKTSVCWEGNEGGRRLLYLFFITRGQQVAWVQCNQSFRVWDEPNMLWWSEVRGHCDVMSDSFLCMSGKRGRVSDVSVTPDVQIRDTASHWKTLQITEATQMFDLCRLIQPLLSTAWASTDWSMMPD